MKVLSKSLFLGLTVFPLAAGLLYCVLYGFGIVGLTAKGFTLDHYKAVFQEGYFLSSMFYSAYQALAGTLFSVLGAFGLFYFIKPRFQKVSGFTWPVLYAPLLMPPMVVAFVFFAFWSNSGLVSRLLHSVGLLSEPTAFPDVVNGQAGLAIILAHMFLSIPFFTINLINIYQGQGVEQLKQLAHSLGASSKQSLVKVELPMLWKYLKRVVALYFIFMFGAYELPLLLGSESSRMLSLVVLDKLTRFDVLAKPQAYAMASMYLAFATCMVFFLFSSLKKREGAKI